MARETLASSIGDQTLKSPDNPVPGIKHYNDAELTRRLTVYSERLNDPTFSILRPSQREANHATVEGILSGKTVLTQVQTTGSGKTGEFTNLIEAADLVTVVFVPRIKLIHQTAIEFEKFTALKVGTDVTKFYGHEKNIKGKVVICTYDSIERLIETCAEQGKKIQLVVLDEAHRSLPPFVHDNVKRLMPGAITLAYTATPAFNEEKDVRKVYGNPVYELKIQEAVERGINSGARVIGIKTTTSLKDIDTNESGEFNSSQLEDRINTRKRNLAAVKLLQHPSCKGKGAVAFCNSKKHAEEVDRLARAEGIKSAYIHSDMSENEREIIYSAFDRGGINLLCSVDLLNEGWDSPRAKIGLMLRPTNSVILAEQRGGRLLRLFQDQFATIFEFLDDSHGITMVDVLGGTTLLPASLEEAVRQSDRQNGEFAVDYLETLGIEGFEVHIEQQKILDLLKGQEPDPISNLTLEKTRDILLRHVSAKECADIRNVGEFLSQKLDKKRVADLDLPEGFTTFRHLAIQYFHDVRHEPVGHISPKTMRIFLEDTLGDSYKEELSKRLLTEINISDSKRREVLRDVLAVGKDVDPSEFMDAIVSVKGYFRGDLTVRQILQKLKIADGLDSFAVQDPKTGIPVGISESRISLREHPERAFLALVQSILSNDEDVENYLLDRAEAQTIRRLSHEGTLQLLIEATPNFQTMTRQDFQKIVVRDGFGHTCGGKAILAYYEIANDAGFTQLISQLEPIAAESPSPNQETTTLGQDERLKIEAARGATPHDVRRFLDIAYVQSEQEILNGEIRVGPSREKVSMSGFEFLRFVCKHPEIRRGPQESVALTVNAESMARLYDFAYPSRSSFMPNWEASRTITELCRNGTIANLIQSDPFVVLWSYDKFRSKKFTVPDSGIQLFGSEILKRFNVSNQTEYQAFVDSVMPEGYRARATGAILENLKSDFTSSTNAFLHDVSFADFRNRKFRVVADSDSVKNAEEITQQRNWGTKVFGITTQTGTQLMEFLGLNPLSFTDFKKCLDQLSGQKRFSRTFAIGDTDSVCQSINSAIVKFCRANGLQKRGQMTNSQLLNLDVEINSGVNKQQISLSNLIFLYNHYSSRDPSGLGSSISTNAIRNSGNANRGEIEKFLIEQFTPWYLQYTERRRAEKAALQGTEG